MYSQDVIDRFESQYRPEAITGCWLWSGSPKNNHGHGAFKIGPRNSKVEYAHRVAYRIYKGSIPDGMVVRHICHTSCCVNPSHLVLGTQKDNSMDAVLAGRHAHGEKHVWAKATEELVAKMKKLGDRAEAIRLGIAGGISRQAAHDIMSSRTWKHVV